MKQTQKDLMDTLVTIECQHRHYVDNMDCPAAKYLRAEWQSWAEVLRKEYPMAAGPLAPRGEVSPRPLRSAAPS